ncbi:UDP-N-acetylglucosamine 2-epimerase (hydrolysing) [Lachnospiraceae bacterium]|nr:UDP-N-acetylglucosamine 2-epimerase (hydrolysing) [Lachnospiraceae bacterium]
MDKKKILFITGSRSDYGKIKPLIKALERDNAFEVFIFVCGMHLVEMLGSTYDEVIKDGYKNVHVAYGLSQTNSASINLGNIVSYLTGYVNNVKPDMIVVHGDRVEALAGAIVGAFQNIFVGHIEGGEVSGTIDESIRHAISKFAHFHFVCTKEANDRLIQLGEEKKRIFIIGSPDIDVMLGGDLPSFITAQERYGIKHDVYGILMMHPVTTEFYKTGDVIKELVSAVIKSKKNYIVIYPNNDLGSEVIINEYNRLLNNSSFRVIPSMRFEYFITFLKNADFIIGNSSAGIREAGIYGIPAIDIGTRQNGRYSIKQTQNIQHVTEKEEEILGAIRSIERYRKVSYTFGQGNSTQKFMEIIKKTEFWNTDIQKRFIDMV